MKNKILGICLLLATGLPQVFSSDSTKDQGETKIGFYKVPLVCPAATQIGCGSRSKPILLALEKDDAIKEAWLNRQGTVIAVVWKEKTDVSDSPKKIKSIFNDAKMEADGQEIKGSEASTLMNNFLSREGWYRATGVDQLSREEAGIIADRLIASINKINPLSKDKIQILHASFSEIFRNKFLENKDYKKITKEEWAKCEKEIEQKLIDSASKLLDEEQMKALKASTSKMYSDNSANNNAEPSPTPAIK